jgi:hypothetical protein
MQNSTLPSKVCLELDRLNRNFLWGSTVEKKKMHMVGWKKVCRTKNEGGLGLSCAKLRNVAILAKLNWRLLEEKESPWAKTILAKYFPNGFANSQPLLSRSGSSNWRGLKLGFDVFRSGLRWVVNNGQRVSFWHDRWIGDAPLRTFVQGPLSLSECSLQVSDVVGSGSVWNLGGLSLLLPTSVVDDIRAIYVCSLSPKEDCLAWDSNKR